jgi:LuxR family transcriptional regulator, maltose regulon positive regulatory protein
MSSPILATKLYSPPPGPKLVPRSRLIERLNEGLRGKLILISAPAGFGKTTLVSEWINSKAGGGRRKDESSAVAFHPFKVAWLSLDEGDNDLAHFLTYLIAALQTIAPRAGEATLSALHSSQPPPADVLLTALLNDVTPLGAVVLVLDDYHVIESPPVDDALTFFVDHLPPQLRLVIASREDPSLPLARLRARGQLTELRVADLRFTPNEAAAFLNEAMRLNLSAANITALETRTEGWIAGLQLAALSMQGRSDTANFIQAFTGSHRFVLDYLMEEVLQRQPEAVRSFLLQTSILERLSGPVCDALTERKDGRRMLEMLEHDNLFVVPLDDQRQWYRYHHLFADVLQARLIEEQPDRVSELHRRASVWYEQNNLPAEAIHHALIAQDFDRAANLIERVWLAMDLSYQSAAWLRWAQQLPDDLIRVHPVLCLGYAWALLNGGELEASEAWLRAVERWIDPTPEDAAKMIVVDEAEYRSLPAAIAAARAYRALALGDISGTIEYARQALTLAAEGDRVRRTQALALLGMAEYASGDLQSAERSLLIFQAAARQGGDIASALGITFILANMWLAQGRLREAISAYQQALHLATNREALPIGTSDLYRGLSELLCEQGDLDNAAQNLITAQKVGELSTLTGWLHRLGVAQARLKQAQGDLSGALDLLDQAERQYVRNPLPDQPIAAMKARVWIRQGKLSEAERWAHEQGLSADDDLHYLREFEHLTLARVFITRYRNDRDEGAIREVLRLLDHLLQAAEVGGRIGSVIEILMLQALAHHAQGNISAATTALERSLILAEPEGYVQLFVAEGEPMRLLMANLGLWIEKQQRDQHSKISSYAEKLLAAFSSPMVEPQSMIVQRKSEIRNQKSEIVEPLSERELEVLKLLGTELSGPEIARQLSVSLNTVRTHTKNIYSKLGVSNRRAAVRRAEELDLL